MSSSNRWSSDTILPPSLGLASPPSRRVRSLVRDVWTAQLAALPWAFLAITLALMLLGVGIYVLAVTGKPLGVLVRDANAIAGQPNYFGALEHAEILLMSGAGWIAAFSSLFCRGQSKRLLFLGGLLSLLLAADDLYMIHESSWRLGIDEPVIFALYAVLLLALVATNLQKFMETPFVLLGVAMAMFAAAVVIDTNQSTPFGLPGGAEDCLELTGICFWMVYFVKCSRDALLARSGDRA